MAKVNENMGFYAGIPSIRVPQPAPAGDLGLPPRDVAGVV